MSQENHCRQLHTANNRMHVNKDNTLMKLCIDEN